MWKLPRLQWFAIALIYLGFFGLIGVTIYITKSSMPLWALLLTPSFSTKDDGGESKSE